jgi:hypothetical protein
VILLVLWHRGFARRADVEKLRFFLGAVPDRLTLSRRYPLWRALSWWRLAFSRRYADGVATWLTYRMNLYDGVEG